MLFFLTFWSSNYPGQMYYGFQKKIKNMKQHNCFQHW